MPAKSNGSHNIRILYLCAKSKAIAGMARSYVQSIFLQTVHRPK